MGGAICYYTYERNPKLWSGVVFVCPMLKVSDDILPPQWIIDLFQKVIGPTGSPSPIGWLPIAPTKNIQKKAFRLPEKRFAVCNFPCFYGRQPRLITARELMVSHEYNLMASRLFSIGCFILGALTFHYSLCFRLYRM